MSYKFPEIVTRQSSEKCTNTWRYELNILDFETNPRYFPSSLTTGKFHAFVSSNVCIHTVGIIQTGRNRSHQFTNGKTMIKFLTEHDVPDIIQQHDT